MSYKMKKQNIFETDIWTGKIEVDNEKIKKARIVVGSMSRAPLFMVQASETLSGKSPADTNALKKASDIAMDNAATFAVHNVGSTLEYRSSMVAVMVFKALEEVAGKA